MAVFSQIKKRTINLADISQGFYSQYTGISNEVIGNTLKIICSVASRGGTLDFGTLPIGTYKISLKKFSAFLGEVETPLKVSVQVNGKGINVSVSESIKGTFTLSEPSTVKIYHAFANSYDYYILEDLMLYKGEEEKEFVPYRVDITKYNNKTIKNIKFNGEDYHFAKKNEVTDGYCENAVNEPIIDMQVSGNSVQNGTPSLENPIEILSVGDKTKNLAEKLFNINSSGASVSSTILIQQTNKVINSSLIKVEGGQKYVLSRTVQGQDFRLFWFDTKPILGETQSINGAYLSQTQLKITITSPDNAKYLFVRWSEGYDAGNVQIEKGKTATEYEPYGYKIPVKASGKNLFNPSNWAGGTITEFNGVPCLLIKDTGQTYSYTLDGDSSDVYIITFKYYRASDSEDKVSNFYSATRGALTINTKHNTLYTNTVYGGEKIYFTGWGRDMYLDLTITQLEKGKVATTFEPYIEPVTTNIYLKEPLRMINDIADVLDYKNKKVIRNVGSVIYNATESWSKYDSANGYMESNSIFPDGKPVLCNMLASTDKLIKEPAIRKNYANIYVYGVQDYYPTVAEWHAFLAENNMEVIGQLVTPTEETIELPTIETFDGTTNFEIDTQVKPTGLSVTYWKQI